MKKTLSTILTLCMVIMFSHMPVKTFAGGSVTNKAELYLTPKNGPAPSGASKEVSITSFPGWQLSISDNRSELIQVGDLITYTVSVTLQTDVSDFDNFKVAVLLPSSLDFVSSSSNILTSMNNNQEYFPNVDFTPYAGQTLNLEIIGKVNDNWVEGDDITAGSQLYLKLVEETNFSEEPNEEGKVTTRAFSYITYHNTDANEDYDVAPEDPNKYQVDEEVIVLGEPRCMIRYGYEIVGWSATEGSDTVDYNFGDTIVFTGYMDLYPVWQKWPVCQVEDPATGVMLYAEEGIFPQDATFVVTPIERSTVLSKMPKDLRSKFYQEHVNVYDVEMQHPLYGTMKGNTNEMISAFGNLVTVYLPVPEEFLVSLEALENLRGYYFGDNFEKTEQKETFELIDGKLYSFFDTEHFSLYGVADERVLPDETKEKVSAKLKTGDDRLTLSLSLCFINMLAGGLYLLLKQKRRRIF